MTAPLLHAYTRRPVTATDAAHLEANIDLILDVMHAGPRLADGQLWERAAERVPSGRYPRPNRRAVNRRGPLVLRAPRAHRAGIIMAGRRVR
ncbi:hypothetical protein SEA_CARON_56 [Microbacterium phage Caron]|uniref:Uncharacterized protein n=1 Tax=Microbacterium phage Caron TaxID=3028494 RepID=A0AAE9ZK26_9CAUD|nr:hypothetical protein SEA_CARON_56 [Microbacterium phage Caron]